MRIQERGAADQWSENRSEVVLKQAGSRLRRPHPGSVAAVVEEEFHTIDLSTRQLTAQADSLVEQLPADRFSSELQRSVLEANSRPYIGLVDLAGDIAALWRAAIAVAQPLGLGIVAVGTVPIADPDTIDVTSDPRYQHMRGKYRRLVREQLICGMQVHVDVDDRDLAVAVAHRLAPGMPALLALSASSPFWLETDTGYASYRILIWAALANHGCPRPVRVGRGLRPDRGRLGAVRGHNRPWHDLLRCPPLGPSAHGGAAHL